MTQRPAEQGRAQDARRARDRDRTGFDAPRERVWAAHTDPDLIPRWWGLRESDTRVERLDLRPGGAWRFVESKADGSEIAFRGVYREVTPPARLVYTFECEINPGHVLIDTVELEDLGERTKLIVALAVPHR